MLSTIRASAFILILVVFAGSAPAVKTAFLARKPTPSQDFSKRTGVVRVRAVSLNRSLFDQAAATAFLQLRKAAPKAKLIVRMNFFNNRKIDVQWEKVEPVENPAGVAWTGTVPGTRYGQATLIYSLDAVTANVTKGDGWLYQIHSAADRGLWAVEVDQSKFPRDHPPDDRR